MYVEGIWGEKNRKNICGGGDPQIVAGEGEGDFNKNYFFKIYLYIRNNFI